MRRIVIIAVIVSSLVAAISWRVPAQPSSVVERAAAGSCGKGLDVEFMSLFR